MSERAKEAERKRGARDGAEEVSACERETETGGGGRRGEVLRISLWRPGGGFRRRDKRRADGGGGRTLGQSWLNPWMYITGPAHAHTRDLRQRRQNRGSNCMEQVRLHTGVACGCRQRKTCPGNSTGSRRSRQHNMPTKGIAAYALCKITLGSTVCALPVLFDQQRACPIRGCSSVQTTDVQAYTQQPAHECAPSCVQSRDRYWLSGSVARVVPSQSRPSQGGKTRSNQASSDGAKTPGGAAHLQC